MSRPSIDTTLTGAGLSLGIALGEGRKPMPSGDALTREAWQQLVRRGEPDDLWDEALRAFEERVFPEPVDASGSLMDAAAEDEFQTLFEVRLEFMMQLIFDAIQSQEKGAGLAGRWVSDVYRRALSGGLPDERHRLIAAVGAECNLTVNLDLLIEAAGAHDVVHLHGTYLEPVTIRTTAAHYLEGLESDLQDRLERAISGKHVLVAGYSGRDRDVLPFLKLAQPAAITWLRHPGSRLEPQVGRVLAECERAGIEVTVETAIIPEWAAANGVRDPQSSGEAAESTPSRPGKDQPHPVELPDTTRIAAIAQVLTSLGFPRQAGDYISKVGEDREVLHHPALRKPRARALSANAENVAGAEVLLIEPIRRGDVLTRPGWVAYRRGVNEAAAMVRRGLGVSWPDAVLQRYVSLARARVDQKTLVAVSQRIAHTTAMRGRIRDALGLMRRLEPLLDSTREPQVRVNALVFQADYLRAAGYYAEAAEKLARAEPDVPYTLMRTRRFFIMMLAHLRLSMGDPGGALNVARHGVDRVVEDTAPATVSAGRGWLALVETNAALAKEELAAAERYLAIARSVTASAWDHPLGHPLVGLHEAALLRAAGEYAACVARSERLVADVRRAKLAMPHLIAAAEFLVEEVRQFADFDGRMHTDAERFEDLAQRFSSLGYRTSAARALGSAYQAGGRQPAPAQIEDWHTWKWTNELAWLGRGRGAPLTHWVLPI